MLICQPIIPTMTLAAIDKVRRIEDYAFTQEQIDIPVRHFLHAGMYARSVTVPAGVMITGALIRVATVLVVSGDAHVYVGDDFRHLVGYNVFAADKDRKQIFVAVKDTDITMLFPTQAKTVKEAEEQFTDEYRLLTTRADEEAKCLEL